MSLGYVKEYDVVVVGAGNAGLMAAVNLQKQGKRTLLVEQHNLPGGCASSFVRGRFEFDPSLHELSGIGSAESPGNVRLMFKDLGLDIGWKKVDDCFRAISTFSDGTPMDITVPSGREEFVRYMESQVPGCTERIERLFELFDEISEGLDFFSNKDKYDVKFAIKHFPNMLVVGSHNTKTVFKALRIPQKCIDILATYWSYLGVDLEHLSFLHYAVMLRSYLQEGAYIPTFTSHELSVALEDKFRELGGEIWFNCKAQSFLFEKDRVCGVRTAYGDVKCDFAVANINEDIVYGKMIPKEHVPLRMKLLSSARKQRFGARMFTVHIGLDATAEELGIKDYSIFMMGTADSAKEYKEMMKGFDQNPFSIFLCYNIANPSISPEGTSMCSFTTFCSPEDWDKLSSENYHEFKTKCAEKLIKQLKDKTGIDLSGHIEEIIVATPWTFARYLGTPEGAVYGHETADWDDIISRTMQMNKDYPIKGLRPVGAGGPRGDGYSSAYMCGELGARMVMKDLQELKEAK